MRLPNPVAESHWAKKKVKKKIIRLSSLFSPSLVLFLNFFVFYQSTVMPINLTFATVNCNSLNMSNSAGSIQKRKIFGITKLRSDIIFLSDLRLSNRNLTNNIDELKKTFRVNPYGSYNFLHHSTSNKRGVGLLIKSNLDFSELQRVVDTDENLLAVKVSVQGNILILCSIYGPNSHNPAFFITMFNAINQLGNFPTIIAGDWNCTYSAANIDVNLDCYNMQDLPNRRHSGYLEQFCEDLGLQDPFRALNPVRRDYTYSPFGVIRENRSRIDFFLVSNAIIPDVSSCEILPCTQNKLFDHKACILSFAKTKKIIRAPRIFNTILDDPDLDIVVWCAAAECYITHFALVPLTEDDITEALALVGRVRLLLRSAGPAAKYYAGPDLDDVTLGTRERCIIQARAIISTHPIEIFHNFRLNIDADIFMDTLLNNIRNEVTSYQHFISKFKNKKFSGLVERLDELKSSATLSKDVMDSIFKIEKDLELLSDEEISNKLADSPLFEHLHNEKMSPIFLKLAKISNNDAKMSDIRDENDRVFETAEQRNDYIYNYYKNVYTQDPNDNRDLSGCIE